MKPYPLGENLGRPVPRIAMPRACNETRCREYGNGYPCGRAVRLGRPQPEVGQDLLNDFGLLDERDDRPPGLAKRGKGEGTKGNKRSNVVVDLTVASRRADSHSVIPFL